MLASSVVFYVHVHVCDVHTLTLQACLSAPSLSPLSVSLPPLPPLLGPADQLHPPVAWGREGENMESHICWYHRYTIVYTPVHSQSPMFWHRMVWWWREMQWWRVGAGLCEREDKARALSSVEYPTVDRGDIRDSYWPQFEKQSPP